MFCIFTVWYVYWSLFWILTEAIAWSCSIKKVFLKIFAKFTERNFQASACNIIEKCFPVNFAIFLRTPFLCNTSVVCICIDLFCILSVLLIWSRVRKQQAVYGPTISSLYVIIQWYSNGKKYNIHNRSTDQHPLI